MASLLVLDIVLVSVAAEQGSGVSLQQLGVAIHSDCQLIEKAHQVADYFSSQPPAWAYGGAVISPVRQKKTYAAGRKHTQSARDATYYLATTGRDSNNGDAKHPWATFAHALRYLKPSTKPVTLIVKDGTYTENPLSVDCAAVPANNGKVAAHVVIKAEHERQAKLVRNSDTPPVYLSQCQYWDFQGLVFIGGDFSRGTYATTAAYKSHHLTFKRNLWWKSNKLANSHLFDCTYGCNYLIFDENEFYCFHRHALDVYGGGYETIRRNYFNSRGDLASCVGGAYADPGDTSKGGSAISLYPAHDSILENNISEGNEYGIDLECRSAEGGCANDKFYGNIGLQNDGSVWTAREGSDAGVMPSSVDVRNHIEVGDSWTGIRFASPKSATCTNCSAFSSGGNGISSDARSGMMGDGIFAVQFMNSLAVNNGQHGFYIGNKYGHWPDWRIDHSIAYINTINFFPLLGDKHITQARVAAPGMGSCYLWIPDSADRLKGKGAQQADIGANVLYRYQDGVLTSQPLWSKSGDFPRGAVVTGYNDVPGKSLFDIKNRLNVGNAACPFPAAYVGW